MAATADSRLAPAGCACCGAPASRRCACCTTRYCSVGCQRADWPRHHARSAWVRELAGERSKQAIRADADAPLSILAELGAKLHAANGPRRAGTSVGELGSAPAALEGWKHRLRQLGHSAALVEEAEKLAATGWTEVYLGPKGRGLRAARPIPAGTMVAIIAGRRVEHDSLLASTGEYSYYVARTVGDCDCLPLAINGSLANDTMPPDLYQRLTTVGIRGFAELYYRSAGNRAVELLPAEPGVLRLWAGRRIEVGEAVEYAYGFEYWAQLVAAGGLPGVAWLTAWNACRELARGVPAPERAAVLESFGRGQLSGPGRAAAESDLGLEPRLPFYFERIGVRLYFGGVQGLDHHGRLDDGVLVFLTPPGLTLTPAEQASPFGRAACNFRRVAEHLARVCPPEDKGVLDATLGLELAGLLAAARRAGLAA